MILTLKHIVGRSLFFLPLYKRQISIPLCGFCTKSAKKTITVELPSYIDINEHGQLYIDTFLRDLKVYPNFITADEEQSLLDEIDPILSRRRYEFDHWDNAIQGFREIDRRDWNEQNRLIIERARQTAFPAGMVLISPVHIVDINSKGWIMPHIDSDRFCGSIISGLSLLSDSVMRLTLDSDESIRCDLHLTRRSLYMMKDDVRYKFKHAVLADEESFFKGIKVPRDRRVSIVSRQDVM